MILKITFESNSNIILPYDYNHILQAVFYNMINDDNFQPFLHDTGYQTEQYKFKLFTFSNIKERAIAQDKNLRTLIFSNKITVYLASMSDDFLNCIIQQHLFNDIKVRLWKNTAVITDMENVILPETDEITVKTQSPITVYSTINEPHKRTLFYNPTNAEFYNLIHLNLIKKYYSYYNQEPEDCTFHMELLNKPQKAIIRYKKFIIEAYNGKFKLSGSKELIKAAFDTGLGAKNSQGFGLILPC